MSRYISSAHIKKLRQSIACVWCGEACKKGQSAFNHVYLEDGEFYRNHFHPECDTARQQYFKESRKAGHYENQFNPYEFARGSVLEKHDFEMARSTELDELQRKGT